MNVFDYFFESSSELEKLFLVGKEEITYNDLYKSSSSLALWLRNEFGEDNNILILSENNLFFIIAYLAIIKSGNICIPLDPGTETSNFKYIAELTEPVLIFLTKEIEKRLPVEKYRLSFPDSNEINAGEPKGIITRKDFNQERCAEIIFTSGSSGKPKGVMISHRNLVANTESIIKYLKLRNDDRMLVVLPFYYCYGLSLLHTHLRVGGSIVLNNSFIFLGSVFRSLTDHKCTGFAGVPTHFQILIRKSDSFRTTEFPSLRYATQAGGKLASVFIDEFRESKPSISFWVMYGQTEATARLSYLDPEKWEEKRGSIGKAIPDVELRVVNSEGKDVLPGEQGEVIARGQNIMMGYFADAEGSDQSIKDGWLYTGDLGTTDEDGYIFLSARAKEIIKVGGKRISPKEIEGVILQIPEVIDCTVEGIEDEIQGEAIKATVVIRDLVDREESEALIKEHCARNLALHKIPRFYEIKEKITITATGKKIKGK